MIFIGRNTNYFEIFMNIFIFETFLCKYNNMCATTKKFKLIVRCCPLFLNSLCLGRIFQSRRVLSPPK